MPGRKDDSLRGRNGQTDSGDLATETFLDKDLTGKKGIRKKWLRGSMGNRVIVIEGIKIISP